MIPGGNVGSCVNYFPSVFVDIYRSSSETCWLIAPFVFEFGKPSSHLLTRLKVFPRVASSKFCFALAINDIVTAVPDEISCSLYVDDFVLYLSCSTLPSVVRRMQLAINRVAD